MKDAPIKQGMEEFVSDMVPKLRFAAMKDAPIKQGREESVQVMVQRLWKGFVDMKVAPNMLRKEEYVLGMVQSWKLAAVKDVPIKPGKEESVSDMEQMACK